MSRGTLDTKNMKIELGGFDKEFLENLEDKEMVSDSPETIYHAIFCDGEKVGVIGFFPAKFPDTGFVQYVIDPNFRGKGITIQAIDLLVVKYNLKILYATIKKDNLASIRVSQKAGFQILTEKEMDELRQKSFLQSDEIRLEKHF